MAGNKSVGRSGASQSVRSAKRRENLSVSAAESLQAPQGDGQQARDEQQQQRGGRREGRTHHVRARVLAPPPRATRATRPTAFAIARAVISISSSLGLGSSWPKLWPIFFFHVRFHPLNLLDGLWLQRRPWCRPASHHGARSRTNCAGVLRSTSETSSAGSSIRQRSARRDLTCPSARGHWRAAAAGARCP
jgi:hypothetical protein